MLTDRLINELGLLKLQSKHLTHNSSEILADLEAVQGQSQKPQAETTTHSGQTEFKLDKNEFRLLVKMLQAIGHECQYDAMSFDGKRVTYQHPKITLIFDDINQADNNQTMNLSRLADMLSNDQLKRPVWEKLKTLRVIK